MRDVVHTKYYDKLQVTNMYDSWHNSNRIINRLPPLTVVHIVSEITSHMGPPEGAGLNLSIAELHIEA